MNDGWCNDSAASLLLIDDASNKKILTAVVDGIVGHQRAEGWGTPPSRRAWEEEGWRWQARWCECEV